MKGKALILMGIVLLLAMAAASAHSENGTSDVALESSDVDESPISLTDGEKLQKTYYYDEDGDEYEDDTVVTHNVVKYYGDKETKFKVKVYDDNYNPMEGVYVSLVKFGHSTEKKTNSKGIVYFPINYKAGTYEVETYIESEDGNGFWSAYNKVEIKSTIPVSELVKYSDSNRKFKIKFLDTKGHKLKDTFVKLKIKGKKYRLKTDSNGIVKIKSKGFGVGKTKIIAYNPKSGEKRKISVVVLKRGVHKINIRIDDPTWYFPTKKLSNGDRISTVYETEYKQYNPGVYVEAYLKGLDKCRHTKLIKAKFFFKNKKTGKVVTKTSSKVRQDTIVVKPIKGYSPYKATVWYRDK